MVAQVVGEDLPVEVARQLATSLVRQWVTLEGHAALLTTDNSGTIDWIAAGATFTLSLAPAGVNLWAPVRARRRRRWRSILTGKRSSKSS